MEATEAQFVLRASKGLRRLLLVVTCLAFLSPIIGPLLDHHFAERQPGHVHIYFGEQTLDHDHPFGTVHHHDVDFPPDSNTQPAEYGGIAFLTSDDAASPGFVSLTSVSINNHIVFPDSGESSLRSLMGEQENLPDEAFPGVLLRPPIA